MKQAFAEINVFSTHYLPITRFPYGLGLQNIMNGGRGYYGDPGYGRVSRPVYGRTGGGVYGGSSPRGADGYYDREVNNRQD